MSERQLKRISKRICMVVRNAATRDARVMKEARSLADAGHDVLVVGIKEKGWPESEVEIDENLKVIRLSWRARSIKLFALLFMLGVGLVSLALLLLGYTVFSWLLKSVSLPALILGSTLPAVFIGFMRSRISDSITHYKTALREEIPGPSTSSGGDKKILGFLKKVVVILMTNRPFMRAISQFQPDILHCHDIGTLTLGVSAKKKLGCKLVYDAHEIYEEAVGVVGEMKNQYRRIHRMAQGKLDGFITINESFIDYYARNYPGFPKATLVMNATRRVDKLSYDGRLHERAGLPPQQRILLFQGGFTPKRGVHVLAKSAAFMPEDWSVVFMGWGKLEEDILSIAKGINKDGETSRLAVIPPAKQSELVYWTAGATIGVIPYEPYGLNHKYCTPNKLWEFPSANVPVLVSPREEMRKMVEGYGYGWLLEEPVTPASLGGFISAVRDEDIKKVRQACQGFIQARHWGVFERNLLQLYKKLG